VEGKYFNTTLICVHAPSEEKNEEQKDYFISFGKPTFKSPSA
jgi:hypothetical protein